MGALAVDFGTSNTVAMVRGRDGRARPLLFGGAPLLPSAVYAAPDGRVLVGRDAEHSARLDPSRFEPNPKRRIDDGQVYLGERELSVPQLFSHVLATVATEARRQLGGAPTQVRLTHPARWGQRRRRLLWQAAGLAGLGTPQLVPEPVAAASYFTAVLGTAVPVGRCLAVYDLGGGTFDATVVRRTPTGFDVLAEEGMPDVGGVDFDHAAVAHLAGLYRASHPEQWAALTNPTDPAARRDRRLFLDDVRAAKEMLSRRPSVDVHIPALQVDAHLTRQELERLVRPYLEQTVACLGRALTSAGLATRELVGIFLVGGSSRIPLAAQLVHAGLGVAATTLEQPETVVAEGALCIGAARPSAPAAPPATGPPAAAPPPAPGLPAAAPRSPAPGGWPPVGAPISPAPPAPGPPAPGPPAPGGWPPAGTPVSPAHPVPGRVPRVAAPLPPPAARRRREPAAVATAVVLALVALAFLALLVAALT